VQLIEDNEGSVKPDGEYESFEYNMIKLIVDGTAIVACDKLVEGRFLGRC